MGERDERTGLSRVRANAAYVAARANRDVWPRNEKTGAELLREAAAEMRAQHEPKHQRHTMLAAMADWLENEANAAEADAEGSIYGPGVVDFILGDGGTPGAVAVARAYLSAPVSAGEPKEDA